jgi:hypothetical protein
VAARVHCAEPAQNGQHAVQLIENPRQNAS